MVTSHLRGARSVLTERARRLRVTFGLTLLVVTVVSALAAWGFGALAEEVLEGATQSFDDAVLGWIAVRQHPTLSTVMLQITTLGDAVVLSMIAAVSALLLWLTRHRYSALLLIAALAGGAALTFALKMGFGRSRPDAFAWGQEVLTLSFPSGHASLSTVTYGMIAFIAAKLDARRWVRAIAMTGAALAILAICTSRLFLGVHYPSDIAAGILLGVAWSAFCMVMLETVQRRIARQVPEEAEVEEIAAA